MVLFFYHLTSVLLYMVHYGFHCKSGTPKTLIWQMTNRDKPIPLVFHRVPTTANQNTCTHREMWNCVWMKTRWLFLGDRDWCVTNRADVLKKRPCGKKSSLIRGQWKEACRGRRPCCSRGLLVDPVHDATNNQTNADQKAQLWHPDGDLVVYIKTWENRCDFKSRNVRWKRSTLCLHIGHSHSLWNGHSINHLDLDLSQFALSQVHLLLLLTNLCKWSQEHPKSDLKGNLHYWIINCKQW